MPSAPWSASCGPTFGALRRFWRSQSSPRASAKERTVLRFKLNQEGQLVRGGTSDLHRSPVIYPDG